MHEDVRGYKRLIVWQQGMALAKECYLVTKGFPRDEMFGLTSQIRRAASSIPANIAEGSARGTNKDFANFLRISLGSLRELETYLLIAESVDLLRDGGAKPLLEAVNSVGILLCALLRAKAAER